MKEREVASAMARHFYNIGFNNMADYTKIYKDKE